MLKDEVEEKKIKRKGKKWFKSTMLTCKTRDPGYKTRITS
jgi:hypothetical protein